MNRRHAVTRFGFGRISCLVLRPLLAALLIVGLALGRIRRTGRRGRARRQRADHRPGQQNAHPAEQPARHHRLARLRNQRERAGPVRPAFSRRRHAQPRHGQPGLHDSGADGCQRPGAADQSERHHLRQGCPDQRRQPDRQHRQPQQRKLHAGQADFRSTRQARRGHHQLRQHHRRRGRTGRSGGPPCAQ